MLSESRLCWVFHNFEEWLRQRSHPVQIGFPGVSKRLDDVPCDPLEWRRGTATNRTGVCPSRGECLWRSRQLLWMKVCHGVAAVLTGA